MEKLAILGGEKTVTLDHGPEWPMITKNEIDAVASTLKEKQLSIRGSKGIIGEFEENFKKYTGCKYAATQCNGTSTLHAAYFAAGIQDGDEVIVPSYTWHAVATPILQLSGKPIFCEVDPTTLVMDLNDVKKKITIRTKTITAVHTFGYPVEVEKLSKICKSQNISLIEDCSHAHGVDYKGKKLGTFGDIACFSLQKSKPLQGGEAGIIITDNKELYDRILILGHYGRLSNLGEKYKKYSYTGIGFKYRAHPLAIAIANEQLRKLDLRNKIKKINKKNLSNKLKSIDGIIPPEMKEGLERGYHDFMFQYYEDTIKINKDIFIKALIEEGVPIIADDYKLLHKESLFTEKSQFNKYPTNANLPISEELIKRTIRVHVPYKPNPELIEQYYQAFKKVIENKDQLNNHFTDK